MLLSSPAVGNRSSITPRKSPASASGHCPVITFPLNICSPHLPGQNSSSEEEAGGGDEFLVNAQWGPRRDSIKILLSCRSLCLRGIIAVSQSYSIRFSLPGCRLFGSNVSDQPSVADKPAVKTWTTCLFVFWSSLLFQSFGSQPKSYRYNQE